MRVRKLLAVVLGAVGVGAMAGKLSARCADSWSVEICEGLCGGGCFYWECTIGASDRCCYECNGCSGSCYVSGFPCS
jgi:hypothetical protein